MTQLISIVVLIIGFLSCVHSQNKNQDSYRRVGGPCEGCEAIFEFGKKNLTSVDTLPGFNDLGQKIKVTGTIYQIDGKTPAKDVILYVYHTDQNGIYAKKGGETGWANRHGYIRGWVKTDKNGKYTFYTLKPGVYPSRTDPAHIHPTILEPDGKYYWIQDYYFEGDSLLTAEVLDSGSKRRGGNGLLTLKKQGSVWVGTRDIILGKNISGYK